MVAVCPVARALAESEDFMARVEITTGDDSEQYSLHNVADNGRVLGKVPVPYCLATDEAGLIAFVKHVLEHKHTTVADLASDIRQGWAIRVQARARAIAVTKLTDAELNDAAKTIDMSKYVGDFKGYTAAVRKAALQAKGVKNEQDRVFWELV